MHKQIEQIKKSESSPKVIKNIFDKEEIKDFIVKLSSKYADFLNSILHDLTIIKELNSSLIFKLLKPIVNRASVLALSKYFK